MQHKSEATELASKSLDQLKAKLRQASKDRRRAERLEAILREEIEKRRERIANG